MEYNLQTKMGCFWESEKDTINNCIGTPGAPGALYRPHCVKGKGEIYALLNKHQKT